METRNFYFVPFFFQYVVSSLYAEQTRWPMVNGMNDIYSMLYVIYEREQTGCLECAIRAKTINGESFSCHNNKQMCLVHNTCLVKSNLTTGTWIPATGWKHFCTKIQITSGDFWMDIGSVLTRKLSIQFAVRASKDAYFGLSSGNTSASSGYWVVLGGWNNLRSCLRDGFVYTSTCYYTHTGSFLTSTKFVRFWVKWYLGHVSVGISETVGEGQIMEFNFPNVYPVSNILLKSSENAATWIIYL